MRGPRHVHPSADIGSIAGHRILDRARHGSQRSLVQDILDAGTGTLAGLEIAYVSLHKPKAGPGLGLHQSLHLIEILSVSGGKIIEPDHVLAKLQQRLEEVGSNEASHSGDQPGGGTGGQVFSYLGVVASHEVLGMEQRTEPLRARRVTGRGQERIVREGGSGAGSS